MNCSRGDYYRDPYDDYYGGTTSTNPPSDGPTISIESVALQLRDLIEALSTASEYYDPPEPIDYSRKPDFPISRKLLMIPGKIPICRRHLRFQGNRSNKLIYVKRKKNRRMF